MVSATYTQAKKIIAFIILTLALVLASVSPALAADYNCGAYGAGAYDSGSVCGAATTDGGGGLVNTGQALSLAIPAILILLGTIMLFRVRRKVKQRPTTPPQA
jgi:hypothetical protein